MNNDLIDILKTHQSDRALGKVAQKALAFIQGSTAKSWKSPGTGESSLSVANTYKIRIKHKTHQPEAFFGLEESILSLTATEVMVHLSVAETDQGVVSVWLADDRITPVAIVVGKFPTSDKSTSIAHS